MLEVVADVLFQNIQKVAIKPGQSETITVSFDSNNKPGMQQKSVTLSANTSSGEKC